MPKIAVKQYENGPLRLSIQPGRGSLSLPEGLIKKRNYLVTKS